MKGNLVGHIVIEREVVGSSFREKGRYAQLNSMSVFPHPRWRHKGLGSEMIKEFERCAIDFRATKVVGEIGSADYEEEPWLPDFYKKLGFELIEKGGGFLFVKELGT